MGLIGFAFKLFLYLYMSLKCEIVARASVRVRVRGKPRSIEQNNHRCQIARWKLNQLFETLNNVEW